MLLHCRAAGVYGSPQFEEMRAKCIGQELSWEVPAAKWEQVLLDLQAGRKPQVQQWTLCHPSIDGCCRRAACVQTAACLVFC